ncbi:hypothetical protein ALP66_03859, partial [Pseudomonas amygdali pv. photiniae]
VPTLIFERGSAPPTGPPQWRVQPRCRLAAHASRSNCSDVSARLCNERASLLPGLLSGWLFLQRCLKEVFDR